jgi:hypothetical protein
VWPSGAPPGVPVTAAAGESEQGESGSAGAAGSEAPRKPKRYAARWKWRRKPRLW